MRITVLAALFVLLLQPAFAAVMSMGPDMLRYNAAIDTVNTGPDQNAAAGQLPDNLPKKPLYEKGKGTLGLIAGIVLGPIGYFGVRFSTHNLTVRKKAEQGLIIWATAVLVTACILFIAAGAAGKSKGGKLPKMGGGGTSSSDEKKKRKPTVKELSQQPPFIQP